MPSAEDQLDLDEAVSRHVSLGDAVAFCDALSKKEGKTLAHGTERGQTKRVLAADGYRLPTEAEWEFACRAGTTTPWWFGDDPHGPLKVSERLVVTQCPNPQTKLPVPNPFGLYRMYGGALEHCYDSPIPYRPEPAVDPFIEPGEIAGIGVMRGGSMYSDGGKDWIDNNSFIRKAVGMPGIHRDFNAWFGLGRVVLPIMQRPHR